MERLEERLRQTQNVREEDAKKAADRLRRELTAKDRQIESLEEQLRRNTSAEIRRLKRGQFTEGHVEYLVIDTYIGLNEISKQGYLECLIQTEAQTRSVNTITQQAHLENLI